jgi:hypothetical protein
METKSIIEKMLKGETPEEAFREAKLKSDPRIKVTLTKRNSTSKA